MIEIAAKSSLVKELFVHTADENYITARWCGMNDLSTDFLWLATHALEKYLKAVLLMNAISAKSQGHNIPKLYDEVKNLAGVLLPDGFVWSGNQPAVQYFRKRTTKEFIRHLHQNGNADNRYLIYGYVTFTEDLHMLDQMVFNIRRLICALDARVFDDSSPEFPTFTHREVLEKQPHYGFLTGLPLDNFIKETKSSQARNAALDNNFAFAPADFAHTTRQVGHRVRNPVIDRRVFEPLKSSDPQEAKEGIEAALWILDNMRMPGNKDSGVVSQIKTAIQSAKSSHGLP